MSGPEPDAAEEPAAEEPASEAVDSSRHGVAFWFAAAVAAGLMGVGVAQYLEATPDAHRRIDLARWIVGLDVAHDALVAPLVCLVGAALARWVPRRPRRYLRAGLLGSATVLVLAWLPLHRTGDVARNPTIQPLDYPTATLTALVLVWGAVATTALVEWSRRRPPAVETTD